MRDRTADLAALLQDPNAYFYVCGLKAMEEGVVLALRDIATQTDSTGQARLTAVLPEGGALALSSRLLADPASDWPANTRTCGFPLYDGLPLDRATAERRSATAYQATIRSVGRPR
mgnify:CR=1 FL=1